MAVPGSPERVDVIIAGAGSAALTAAIAARQLGAERIVMLEKAPEPEFGGNPRFSYSSFRWVQYGPEEIRGFLRDMDDASFAELQFKPYTEDDFHAHINRVTRGRMKPEFQQLLVGESNEAMHWLNDVGLLWDPRPANMRIDGKIYFEPGYSVHPRGGGLGQLEQLREIALGMGIELRYESKVAAIHGTMWQVEGVRVESPEGAYDMVAPATILCAGGFQASREARARYLGPNADLMKVRGSRHNTGEVLRMALDLGAAAAGHWQAGHSAVVDANAPDVGVLNTAYNRNSYMFGITVNTRGERFVDEGSNLRMMTYAKMGWLTLAQPEGMAWQIFDQKIARRTEDVVLEHAYEEAPVRVEAKTITELAELMDVPVDALQRTVDEYNAAVPEEGEFIPTQRDGRATTGLRLPKSNWANRIDEAPFVAFPVTAGITFTFGGIDTDADARVLNTQGVPIRGLYASGDIVGFFYHGYVGSSGQTRNVVFSRRAARHATQ